MDRLVQAYFPPLCDDEVAEALWGAYGSRGFDFPPEVAEADDRGLCWRGRGRCRGVSASAARAFTSRAQRPDRLIACSRYMALSTHLWPCMHLRANPLFTQFVRSISPINICIIV